MRHSQKMEALGLLAGGVAHDFNNLLTAIMGFSNVILGNPASAPMKDELEQILTASRRAADLTRQLLTFSRGGSRPSNGSLDVNDVVAGLQHMLARLIGEDITFVVRPDPSSPSVTADRSGLEQVLVNLVINARDAMPDGGRLELAVSTRRIPDDHAASAPDQPAGDAVVIDVRDEGCGMPATVRERIFEPFFTTRPAGAGSGLGLSTAYGIVRGFGGVIEVESEPGAGSCFSVILPPARPDPTDHAPATAAGVVRGSGTVLLVEDEPAVRELIKRVLGLAGYEVLVAGTPSVALRLLAEADGGVDLLLTDVVMPEMTGPQLFDQCQHRQPDLRVLFMSGYPGRDGDHFTGSDGDRPLLEKPFASGVLTRAVNDAMRPSD